MAVITVPGMFLTGNHAGRPAATAVGGGTLYACSDHDLIYQSDGATWSTWANLAGSGIAGITIEDEGTPLTTDATTLDFVGAGVTATGAGAGKTITIPGAAGTTATIQFVIDGGGVAITTGVKGYLEVPFGCTITAARMLADQSGSIVVDIWKDTYANYPPVDADSITASAPPTISTATKSEDTTLTGWTTTISAGNILGYNVDSATTVTRVTVALTVTRT